MDIRLAISTYGKRASAGVDEFYLEGEVQEDSDDRFLRLIPDPLNRRRYFRVQVDDVQGEIHQWTEAELAQAGFAGQLRFRLPLKYGTRIELVQVAIHEIGKTIAGHGNKLRGGRVAARSGGGTVSPRAGGDCEYAPGCGSHNCCSYGSDGECYCDDCCEA